ncbi:MAG: effector-associated constant component EACC1 [Stackebrandtia sp.]
MVEVSVSIAADEAVQDDMVAWVKRIPQVGELDLHHADGVVTATLHSPPQLATLVMAVATYLRTKPTAQRPAVTVTAPNGESLDVTATPNPNAIRSSYIAMDKTPPAAPSAISPEIIDAEITEITDKPHAADS